METEIEYKTSEIHILEQPKRGNSIIIVGDSNKGGVDIKIEVSTRFNWLQKKLWNYLLNIKIQDIKENKGE